MRIFYKNLFPRFWRYRVYNTTRFLSPDVTVNARFSETGKSTPEHPHSVFSDIAIIAKKCVINTDSTGEYVYNYRHVCISFVYMDRLCGIL